MKVDKLSACGVYFEFQVRLKLGKNLRGTLLQLSFVDMVLLCIMHQKETMTKMYWVCLFKLLIDTFDDVVGFVLHWPASIGTSLSCETKDSLVEFCDFMIYPAGIHIIECCRNHPDCHVWLNFIVPVICPMDYCSLSHKSSLPWSLCKCSHLSPSS